MGVLAEKVPQITQMNTDFLRPVRSLNKVTQIAQMTQIFPATISYPQMRPIRSDDTDFSTPLSPSCEERVLIPLPSPRPYHKGKGCSWRRYSSARVLVSQRSLFNSLYDPFGSLCRGQKPKGLAESTYATELRLFVS